MARDIGANGCGKIGKYRAVYPTRAKKNIEGFMSGMLMYVCMCVCMFCLSVPS